MSTASPTPVARNLPPFVFPPRNRPFPSSSYPTSRNTRPASHLLSPLPVPNPAKNKFFSPRLLPPILTPINQKRNSLPIPSTTHPNTKASPETQILFSTFYGPSFLKISPETNSPLSSFCGPSFLKKLVRNVHPANRHLQQRGGRWAVSAPFADQNFCIRPTPCPG